MRIRKPPLAAPLRTIKYQFTTIVVSMTSDYEPKDFASVIFNQRYSLNGEESWGDACRSELHTHIASAEQNGNRTKVGISFYRSPYNQLSLSPADGFGMEVAAQKDNCLIAS
jgi:hypothetical protein